MDPCILVKTGLGMERVVAARISEETGLRAVASPMGFKGLVLVEGCSNPEEDSRLLSSRVPEADRVLVVRGVSEAEVEKIADTASRLATKFISGDKCFAVRTVRRGRHEFTSIDVNVRVGAAIKEATGSCVNLSSPDYVVGVEIIGPRALITVEPGEAYWRKMGPGKNPVTRLFSRIAVVQMPYLGPLEACRTMGVRIGREIQNFEVKELVISPAGMVDAEQLSHFLSGLFEGIESRYEIQRRSYGRPVRRVPVKLMDLHQLVRDRSREPIIVMEPEGEPVSRLADELWRVIRTGKRLNMLIGAREGIPLGIYRFADLVIDIAPGVTLSTEYAASSALIALSTLLHDRIPELME